MKRIKSKRIVCVSKKLLAILPMFFWLILIFGFDEAEMALITLSAALLHEMGHIGYLLISKKITPSIRGVVSGFRIKTSALLSYSEEQAFYLAGPLMNLAMFVFASFLSQAFGRLWSVIAMVNLVSALSNLLPIEGYDGYGIIRTALQRNENSELGLKILSLFSTSLIFLLCIFSLYIINKFNGGYWIFFIFFISMVKRIKEDLR